MKKLHFLLLFILLFSECIKPIELDSIIDHESTLIVDALLTNELKHQVVKLTKSIPLDSTVALKEADAQIKIMDNNNVVYDFSETEKGVYVSNNLFKAEKGKKYTLEILTSDGVRYFSTEEEIVGYNAIDAVSIKKETNKFNEEVLSVYVQSDGSNNKNAQYYRYRLEETYKIIAPEWRNMMFDRAKLPEIVLVANVDFDKICYGSNETTEIILKESSFLSENSIEFPIYQFKEDDFKIAHRYSALVKQYVQSPEAHAYSKKIAQNATSQSLLTQSQPGALIGNITSEKKVIGYFEVSSVSEKRVFFSHSDFFEYNQFYAVYAESCSSPYFPHLKSYDRSGNVTYPLREAIASGDWVYLRPHEYSLEKYYLIKRGCGDCKKYGSNIKPSFWID